MSKPQQYYILTKAHKALWPRGVILFWAENRGGYSTFLEKAGRYSEDEAKSICGLRGQDYMVPCDVIEAQSVRVVDIDKFNDLVKEEK